MLIMTQAHNSSQSTGYLLKEILDIPIVSSYELTNSDLKASLEFIFLYKKSGVKNTISSV
jgi:hypothetical protein